MGDLGESKCRVSSLLKQRQGDPRAALDEVVALVYDELRSLARQQLAGHRRYTLGTTALVDEAYLRMVDGNRIPVASRAYFFGAAAQAMRQVLVDAARRRGRHKRGAGQPPTALSEETVAADELASEVLELHDGLQRLAEHYPRQARVVECRFFGGFSVEETARVLELSERTVARDWTLARAWLYRELRRSG